MSPPQAGAHDGRAAPPHPHAKSLRPRRRPSAQGIVVLVHPLDDDWLASLDEVAAATALDLPRARLTQEIRALSEAYNTAAFARSRTKGALAARLAFFFPRDVPKTGGAVRELVACGRLGVPTGRPLRVLD